MRTSNRCQLQTSSIASQAPYGKPSKRISLQVREAPLQVREDQPTLIMKIQFTVQSVTIMDLGKVIKYILVYVVKVTQKMRKLMLRN